jgi:hypothetical protein
MESNVHNVKREISHVSFDLWVQPNRTFSQIAGLFTSTSVDPLSPKAEYNLAAFIGTNYDEDKCHERYDRCKLDRTVIGTAIGKITKKKKGMRAQPASADDFLSGE